MSWIGKARLVLWMGPTAYLVCLSMMVIITMNTYKKLNKNKPLNYTLLSDRKVK